MESLFRYIINHSFSIIINNTMTNNEILAILKQIHFFPSGALPAQNNIFPPIAVLNDVLVKGYYDHGIDNEFVWTPMTITFEHYMNLFGELKILNNNLTYIPPAEILTTLIG